MKKILAMILAICVVLTTAAMPAFATETDSGDVTASNLYGFELAAMESGKQFEFMLLDSAEKDGSFYILSKELLGGWGTKPMYMEDSSSDYNKILGVYTEDGGMTFDEAYLDNYPEAVKSYMTDTEWDITFGDGDDAYSMTSKLCLPTEAELNANEEAFECLKAALTAAGGPGAFFVRSGWSNDLVVMFRENVFGSINPTGDCAGYFPLVFNVSKDFFKNVKLDVDTMGTSVKNILTGNFTRLEMMNVYSDEELNAIGFAEIEFVDSLNSFTVSAENVEDGRQADYILLSPEENNGSFYILSKGVIGGWGTKPMYMEDSSSDYNKILGVYTADGGMTFDEAYLDTFPAVLQSYMKDTEWDITFGISEPYSMTSKLCLPTQQELEANEEAFEYAKANMTDGPGTFFVRGAWSNELVVMFRDNAFGSINPTGDVAGHFPLVFNVSKDFFKNVKLDVTKMGTNIKNILTANYGRTQLKSVYTDAELDIIGFAENPATTAGASFKLADGEVGKTSEFIVLNSENNDSFYIFSKGVIGGWGTKPMYMEDSSSDYNKILGVYTADGGMTFDEAYLDTFPAVLQSYMKDTEWDITFGISEPYSMTSKLCLPTQLELEANEEAFEYAKANMTDGPGTFFVRGAWSNELVTMFRDPEFGSINPTGDVAGHFPLVFNVSKDFFKNVKLDVASMGDDVRDILVKNVSRFDLEKIYTIAELETVYYGKNDIVPYDKELQISYNTEDAATATEVNAAVKVANNTLSKAEDISVIFAIYANDGRLIDVDVNEAVTVSAFSTADIPLSIAGDAGFANNCTVKAFVWRTMSDLAPLTK